MNICFISREYPTDDHVGGIGTYTEKTARALAALGQTVYVITEAVDGPSTRVMDGVAVIRLAPQRRSGEAPFITRARAVAFALKMLPVCPDIVQACEFGAEAYMYAGLKPAETVLVTRLATPTFLIRQYNAHMPTGPVPLNLIERAERAQTVRSNAIISPSQALAGIVAARWRVARETIAVIPTGVNFASRFSGSTATLPPRLTGKTYVLYFGRLEERKGVHVLARALPDVLRAYPDLQVVFAGEDRPFEDATMRAYIESQNHTALDRLHFFPRLPQQDLYPVLANALVVVMPSLWENLANACLEALDMGKPIVATRGCAFDEVIEDGVSGLLVAPGNVEELQQALITLLGDRRRLERMAHAAKELAYCYDLTSMAQLLLSHYEQLLAQRQV